MQAEHARKVILALALGVASCSVSCGSSGNGSQALDGSTSSDASVCPQPLPASCPTPAPSYTSQIGLLIARRCVPCHGPGGVAYPARDFTTYDKVHHQRTEMLTQIYGCRMPPAGALPLTAEELRSMQTWFVCGAPNN
jgi:hypothetical protein